MLGPSRDSGRKLDDRVAIITGAAGGIGSAGAHIFAREGARMVIVDIDTKGSAALEYAIRESGAEACFINNDISKTEQVQAMISAVIQRYRRIDILWNSATALRGCSEHDGPLHGLPEAEWDFIHSATLRGVFLCSQYALPHMMAARRGVVIHTISTDALLGLRGYHSYAAAKGGIISMTRSMAACDAQYKIRVNTICPGFVRTPPISPWLNGPSIRPAIEALHLTGIGEPEDIANFALYLASDDAKYVTVGIFPIDGALTCFKGYDHHNRTDVSRPPKGGI